MPRKRQPKMLGEPDITAARNYMRTTRQTLRKGSFYGMLPYNYVPRRQYETYDITKLQNSSLTAPRLLSLLPDLHQDVGLALWNVLRQASAGFGYTVRDRQGQEDENAVLALDQIVERINPQAGGVEGLIVQWLCSAFLQGAVSAELALTEDTRDIDDLYPVDPANIVFKVNEAGKFVPYFKGNSGGEIELNTALFWYAPVDPMIDDPYGRSPVAPVLQNIWFDIALLNDLQRVIHNQGWPRIDIEVVEEVLRNYMPPDRQTEDEQDAWVEAELDKIQNMYNDLAPDDNFVHTDAVKINQAASTQGRLFDPTGICRVIERRITKSLKQLPILMASNEGTTETHGTVQWQIYAQGLESLRMPVAFVLGKALTAALQVFGIQGTVCCEFEQIRTTDRQADATAEQVEIRNEAVKWLLGAQTWEDMVLRITGSQPPAGAVPPEIDLTMMRGLMLGRDVTAPATDADEDRLRREVDAIYNSTDED